jgi:hypothetical protein
MRRAVAVGAIVALTGIGFALWFNAEDGEKQADLGSAMLGGAVVGAALLLAEKQFERLTRRQEDVRALATVETAPEEPTPTIIRPESIPSGEQVGTPTVLVDAEYAVTYEGNFSDFGRRDARQVRLRVSRDSEYFQFVTAIAPGPSLILLGALDQEAGGFWLAFSRNACDLIKDAIRRGEIPLSNRTQAYEVFPDVETALKKARAVKDEAKVGEIVCRFRL